MATTTRRLLISSRPMTPDEQNDLKQALRDAILFMAALKMCSAFCYLALYLLVYIYSEGFWSTVLKVMIAVLVPLEILNGLLLFLGALEIQPIALKFAALMCLLVALFNTVMGVIGALFFYRVGDRPMHFLIALIFGLIALCFCSVVCHDVIVISMFVNMINRPPLPPNPSNPPNPPETLAITYNP